MPLSAMCMCACVCMCTCATMCVCVCVCVHIASVHYLLLSLDRTGLPDQGLPLEATDESSPTIK